LAKCCCSCGYSVSRGTVGSSCGLRCSGPRTRSSRSPRRAEKRWTKHPRVCTAAQVSLFLRPVSEAAIADLLRRILLARPVAAMEASTKSASLARRELMEAIKYSARCGSRVGVATEHHASLSARVIHSPGRSAFVGRASRPSRSLMKAMWPSCNRSNFVAVDIVRPDGLVRESGVPYTRRLAKN
jgi:hypothetical protein